MNVEVEETGPVERSLRIDIATTDVDAAFDAVYKQIGRNAHIKGFRKGRVPRTVLEKYYGPQAAQEVMQRLVGDSLPKAIEEHDLDLITEPRLEPALEPPIQGASFAFEAKVEIRPEIELKTIRGLEFANPTLEEPEEDPVEAQLNQLRERQAQLIDEDAGVAAAHGHIARIDFVGKIDGEPFDGGSGEDTPFEIGADRTIPGFEDALIGLQVGDSKTFEVDFPGDYDAEDLAGKTASFEVEVKAMQRRELPALDDEFAKDVSDEFESLPDLRADIEKRLGEAREKELERRTRDAVLDALIDANPFPVPPSLIEAQLGMRLQQAVQQFIQVMPKDQLAQMVEGWRESWRPQAERDVQVGLLIPEIAKAEDIDVTDDDVDAQVRKIAEEQDISAAELRAHYKERGLVAQLRAGLVEERVVEFLTAEATLSDS